MEDIWTDVGPKELSASWRGKTVLTILRPPTPPGYKWVAGRCTKVQETTRPDNIWPEVWNTMSKKQKAQAKEHWENLQQKLQAAREKRGIFEVDPEDK